MGTSEKAAARRAEQLRRELARHDHLYYNLGRPEIDDAAYDRLFQELERLEQEHPGLVRPDSPTRRVGAPLPKGSGFPSAAHAAPMLSIDSLFSEAEVREFDARVRRLLGRDEPVAYAAEPKYDGVSASLVYEHGVLAAGLTRGDGRQGEVITANLRAVRSIPLSFLEGPAPARVEVRGEVLLSREAFARLQEQSPETALLRNPRNAAAGTLKRLDPAEVAGRGLDFIAWGVGALEGLAFSTYRELLEALGRWGFATSPQMRLCASIDEVIAYHAELERARFELPYDLDGLVAKVDSMELRERLGSTARSPRWMLAFKFSPRRALTRVRAIVVQVGRLGTLTPVAELEPVELGGATIQRATLHNEEILRERDVRPGDTVLVERAGDVIPAVVEVDLDKRPTGSRPFAMPAACPACGAQAVAEGAMRFCPNIACPAQIRARILHLTGRRALDIDRLGPKGVDQLMQAGLIQEPADIFFLPGRREQIEALPRWGARSFEKLAEQLSNALNPELGRLLFALGIRGVGETTARDLAAAFPSLEALEAAVAEALQEVEGVGPEVSRAVVEFFRLPANRRFLDRLAEAGLAPRAPAAPEGPLAGTTWCFTGSLETHTREKAQELVRALGARVATAPSASVTHVVAGPGAGSKLAKARKLGLEILDEEAFLALLAREGKRR